MKGLQRVLLNYHALEDRVPQRHWGEGKKPEAVPHQACGYCSKGRCQHGTLPKGYLRPLVSTRTDVHQASELLADVKRQIGQLPPRACQLFTLRYVVRVTDTLPDGRPTFRQHTDDEVMRLLGIRQAADYWRAHNEHLAAMEIRLIDWFERDGTETTAAADELVDEALAELAQELAA